MFEKLKTFLDKSKSMLEEAFVEPEEDDFDLVPPGMTEEQLIEEAKQYVDAIIVPKKEKKAGDEKKKDPSIFLKTGTADEVPDQEITVQEDEVKVSVEDGQDKAEDTEDNEQ